MVRADNIRKAELLNKEYGEYFTSGETIFTSYTSREFIKLFTGAILDDVNLTVQKPSKGSITNLQEEIFNEKDGLAKQTSTSWAVDWTKSSKILVTSVKNQGACASCWAFAIIA
ncbi:MAG: C1 family peptidase [Flammeovirgaceae bacterium]